MFFGLEPLTWFTGVVEDRIDPLKLGRVRVRLHVHHPKEKELNQKTGNGLKTEDLPWAYIMSPVTSPSMDGIGSTPLLVEGTHVVGFSRDGETLNDLVIMGTIGGKPEDAPKDNKGKLGFVDPRTAGDIAGSPRYINEVENRDPGYPGQNIPQGRYPQEAWLKKSNLNRLHRGEDLDKTYIEYKRQNRKVNIKNSLGNWEEKSSPYGAKYPYNNVKETESGHVIELDDTKDAERIHVWHGGKKAKGTFAEFAPDGSLLVKSNGEIDQIAKRNHRTYSEKTVQVTGETGIGLHSVNGQIKIKADKGLIQIESDSGSINITTKVGAIAMTATTIINLTAPVVNVTGILTMNGSRVVTV